VWRPTGTVGGFLWGSPFILGGVFPPRVFVNSSPSEGCEGPSQVRAVGALLLLFLCVRLSLLSECQPSFLGFISVSKKVPYSFTPHLPFSGVYSFLAPVLPQGLLVVLGEPSAILFLSSTLSPNLKSATTHAIRLPPLKTVCTIVPWTSTPSLFHCLCLDCICNLLCNAYTSPPNYFKAL